MINDELYLVNTSNSVLSGQCFIRKIPDATYLALVAEFEKLYHFQNGDRMQIANYYVGVKKSLVRPFVDFIHQVYAHSMQGVFPSYPSLTGFDALPETLNTVENNGGFTFGSFDMAVSAQGLRNIEFQAVATYPISAAKMSQLLIQKLNSNATTFVEEPELTWNDFIGIYKNIIQGDTSSETVIVDIEALHQKTNFEFYATQHELGGKISIVDASTIFENNNKLYYTTDTAVQAKQLHRFYNRILIADALYAKGYPASDFWKFRFDRAYEEVRFVNHPSKQFDISKRLAPYVAHPFNPACYELSEVVDQFREGVLRYEDFVWKHKWGAAGHALILSPSEKKLMSISDTIGDYIAQKKVNFHIFKTEDGLEKIVELRFMTAQHANGINIVPMARIGRVVRKKDGSIDYKIHFGDNNQIGYGFSPVLVFD